MSEVTNMILSFSIGEDESSSINEINLFSNNGRGFNIVSADFEEGGNWVGKENQNRWYGGSKHLETPLYIGAFNNLDIEAFIQLLKGIKWEEPDNVQVILKEQNSNKFKVIELEE